MSHVMYKLMLYLGFLLTLVCSMLTGIDMAFNVYGLLLKQTFQLTQTQVELVASTGTVGLGLSFLLPLLTGAFGYATTFLVTYFINILSTGFLALAAYHAEYFQSRLIYVYVGHLIMCTSYTGSSVCMIGVNVKIVSKKHSGKVLNFISAIICMGKIFYGALIQNYFHDNLSGFFLSISVLSAVFFGLCYSVLYLNLSSTDFQIQETDINKKCDEISGEPQNVDQTHDDCTLGGKLEKSRLLDNKDVEKTTLNTKIQDGSTDFLSILYSRIFLLTVIPAVVLYACGFAYMNNITSIAESVGVINHVITVYEMAVTIIVLRIGVGIIFDKCASEIFGIAIMVICGACFSLAMVIGMLWLDSPGIIHVLAVLSASGVGPSSISTSLIILKFGTKHLEVFICVKRFIGAVIQIALQMVFGVIYDSHQLTSRGTIDICVGKDCFYWTLLILFVISWALLVLQIISLCLSYFARSLVSKTNEIRTK